MSERTVTGTVIYGDTSPAEDLVAHFVLLTSTYSTTEHVSTAKPIEAAVAADGTFSKTLYAPARYIANIPGIWPFAFTLLEGEDSISLEALHLSAETAPVPVDIVQAAIQAALVGYLTTADAASLYATIASLADYLTTTDAASLYATIASLTDYLQVDDAAALYATITNLTAEATARAATDAAHAALTTTAHGGLAGIAGAQSANRLLVGPLSGASAVPTFRALAAADLYSAGVATGIFHAKAYGAVGDGVTNDSPALESACAAAKATGGGTVYLSPGTYVLTRSLYLASNVSLVGAGRSTIITKPATVKSLIAVNAIATATTVTVANGALFTVGQGVHAYDTSSQDWTATPTTISAVNGNVLTLAIPLNGSLQTSRAAAVATSFPLIRNEQASVNVRVSNLVLDGNRTAADPTGQFVLALIHFVETYTSLVDTVWFKRGATDAYSDQGNNGTTTALSQAAVKATRNTIKGCWIDDCALWGIHFGTCMEGAIAIGNVITNCGGSAVHYSAYVQNTICMGNIISACLNGFGELDERDIGNVIIGNTVKACTAWGLTSNSTGGTTGGMWIISSNRFSDCPSGGMLIAIPENTITGNVIRMGTTGNQAIKLTTLADRNLISNNVIEGGGGGSAGIFLENCDDLRILGNNIRGTSVGMDLRGCSNVVVAQNIASGLTNNIAVSFQVTTSTDVILQDNHFAVSTPISESVAATRLVQNGMGNNGSTDPAVGGAWNTVPSGTRYNGRMVRWDNGAGVNTISVRWANAWMKIATT